MGLSDYEQQTLAEIERHLRRSESDSVSAGPSNLKLNLRSLVLGIVVVVAGLGMLVAGVGMQQWWLGLVGFAVMVLGTLLAGSKRDGVDSTAPNSATGAGSKSASRASFSDRMNERWEQRMDGDR